MVFDDSVRFSRLSYLLLVSVMVDVVTVKLRTIWCSLAVRGAVYYSWCADEHAYIGPPPLVLLNDDFHCGNI